MANHDQLGRRSPAEQSAQAPATAAEAIDLTLTLPKLPSIGNVDTFLQRGIETMRGVDLNDLGLRRPEGMHFLTPSLNRIMELRDMRDFGTPMDREQFRERLGAFGEQRHQDDYLSYRLDAEDLRFGVSTPVKLDPVEGRYVMKLLDIRDQGPVDLSLHLTNEPLMARHLGDQEFKYGVGDGSLRFLFQRGPQPEEASAFSMLQGAEQEFWRIGRTEDQSVVFGLHGERGHVIGSHNGRESILGAIYESPNSSDVMSFSYTRGHVSDRAKDTYAMGFSGDRLQMELQYVPDDPLRPLTGYIQPYALGLGGLRVGPVLEFDGSEATLKNPLASPLRGFLMEHRNPNGQASLRGVLDERSFKIEAGALFRF